MATVSLLYASPASLTITLTSLASAGYRESAAVDNTTNLYLDAHVSGSVDLNSTISADGSISIFGYGSFDGGNVYSGGLAGTNETITWGTTPASSSVEGFNNIPLLGVASVDTTDDGRDLEWGPFSVAAGFNNVLPPSWGIVVLNETGASFDATGTNNRTDYRGIRYTVA